MRKKRPVNQFLKLSFHGFLAMVLLIQMAFQWLFPFGKLMRSLQRIKLIPKFFNHHQKIKI